MTIKTTLLNAILGLSILSSMPASADTIKIGFNAPLTGFAASDGKSALNGAELAVKQVNAMGGINGAQLELVVYDDQASPKESVPIAHKLIEKDDAHYYQTPKGDIFEAAKVSGTLGAKKTPDLLPYCHPLPIDNITIHVSLNYLKHIMV